MKSNRCFRDSVNLALLMLDVNTDGYENIPLPKGGAVIHLLRYKTMHYTGHYRWHRKKPGKRATAAACLPASYPPTPPAAGKQGPNS